MDTGCTLKILVGRRKALTSRRVCTLKRHGGHPKKTREFTLNRHGMHPTNISGAAQNPNVETGMHPKKTRWANEKDTACILDRHGMHPKNISGAAQNPNVETGMPPKKTRWAP